MSKYFAVLFFLFQCLLTRAQDDPYYEPIGKRTLEDLKYLPNLETSQNRIYIATSGGVRFLNSKINPINDFFQNGRSTNLYWQVQLGYNIADKWNAEVAYSQNPLFMNTQFAGFQNGQSVFSVNKGESFDELQLRLKRKIIFVDRVSQKTGLFVTTGISYTPKLPNQNYGLSRYVSPIFNGRNIPPDTVFHEIRTLTSQNAFAFELGIELSGRVSDQLGVGVFFKTWFRPKGSISNDLSYRVNSNEPQLFRQESNPFNINTGVMIYYNMLNWVKYRNKKSLLN
jgi:hypothetical protein